MARIVARKYAAARYIKVGVVKFPWTGCERLMTQLLGFGSEKHDDGVGALAYLTLGWSETGLRSRRCIYVRFARTLKINY
jgi:hypothetical protein